MYTVCTTVQDSTTLSKPSVIRYALVLPAAWARLGEREAYRDELGYSRVYHDEFGDGGAGIFPFRQASREARVQPPHTAPDPGQVDHDGNVPPGQDRGAGHGDQRDDRTGDGTAEHGPGHALPG